MPLPPFLSILPGMNDAERSRMAVPTSLVIIAGKGVYPLLLAESAREQGVREISVIAFRGETKKCIQHVADRTEWVRVGQLAALLDALQRIGCPDAVMAGQITPTLLYRLRPDRQLFELLQSLEKRNAETIFGAFSDVLSERGVTVRPAWQFMEKYMPLPGSVSARKPDERESADIALGVEVAKTTSGLEIGQTVCIKEGTVIAVESFEGTDKTMARGGRLSNGGMVVVKVAKKGHDMRFDIPVIGRKTIRVLKKAGATCLAVEAGRCIMLEKEHLIKEADKMKLALIAVKTEDSAQESHA